jgi:hypothetical protein
MDCRFLETALEQACGEAGVVFQVLSQEMYLYVYINRDGESSLDFGDLTQRIQATIVAERLKEIRWLCLYSRVFGMDEPDWEVVLELQPPTLVLDPLPPRSATRSAASARTVRQTDATVLLHDDAAECDLADLDSIEFESASAEAKDLPWSSSSVEVSGDQLSTDHGLLPSTLGLDETGAERPQGRGRGPVTPVAEGDRPDRHGTDTFIDLPIVEVPDVDRPMIEDRQPPEAQAPEAQAPEAKAPEAKAPEAKAAEESPEAKTADSEDSAAKTSEPQRVARATPPLTPIPADRPISDYCFIRNPMLLTSEIQPPSQLLAQLLQDFHQLGEPAQRDLLPHFNGWFRQQAFPQELPWSPEQRAWIDRPALEGNDLRRAPIWFSRYCHNPTEVADYIEKRLNPVVQPEEVSAPSPESRTTAADPARRIPAPAIGGIAESLAEKVEPYRPRFPDWVPLSALAVATLVAIVSTFFVASSFAGGSEALCKLSRSSKYCKLAVEMIGSEPIAKAQKNDKFLTRTEQEHLGAFCFYQAEKLYGGDPIKAEQKEVVKGIVLMDMTVKNERPSATIPIVRVACLATVSEGKMVPLRTDRIPDNWPKEPYKDETGLGAINKAAYIQRNPIVRISTVVVFTTIGLFLAALLQLGIRIYSTEAVVLTALSLAILEAIVFAVLPIDGIVVVMALDVLLLFALSFKIKGLTMELSSGYQMLSMGVGVMLLVRQLLTWLLIASATAIVR